MRNKRGRNTTAPGKAMAPGGEARRRGDGFLLEAFFGLGALALIAVLARREAGRVAYPSVPPPPPSSGAGRTKRSNSS